MTQDNQTSFVSRAEWLEARKDLLAKEKALTKARDELNAERQKLPMVRIEKTYQFDTIRGPETLGDLFKDRSQLIVYHFMFGSDWDEGCPSCSFWMDNFDGIEPHLEARDVHLVTVSSAPLDKLQAYRQRMGWHFDWVSSGHSDFNMDFGVTFKNDDPGPTGGYNYTDTFFGEEAPGMSVFTQLEDGSIGHSYSVYARGLDILNGTYHLVDLTPKGRNEQGLPYPMAWVRRHDQYTT